MSEQRVIKNCIITHSNSNVVKEYGWVGRDYNHSIWLSGTNVYCPCCGVVIDVSTTSYGQSVTVQYSGNVSLRFDGLDNVDVTKGQTLPDNTFIGNVKDRVIFQYLTTQPNDPNNRVFLPLISLYTHDPNLVLNGNVRFESSDKYYNEDEIFETIFSERGFENYED